MLKTLFFTFVIFAIISCIDLADHEVVPINSNSNGQLYKFGQNKKFAFEVNGN